MSGAIAVKTKGNPEFDWYDVTQSIGSVRITSNSQDRVDRRVMRLADLLLILGFFR